MSIKAFFIPQGFVIADVEDVIGRGDCFIAKNPALVVTRPNGVLLAPILQMVEETSIRINISDVSFNQLFTPHIELANEYSKIFGSGIIVSNVLPL